MTKSILILKHMLIAFSLLVSSPSFSESIEATEQSQIRALMDTETTSDLKEEAIRYLSQYSNPDVLQAFSDTVINEGIPLCVRIKAFHTLVNIAEKETNARSYSGKAASVIASIGADSSILREYACRALFMDLNQENTKKILNILLMEMRLDPEKRGRVEDVRLQYRAPDTIISMCTDGLILRGKAHTDIVETMYKEQMHNEVAYCLIHILYKHGHLVDSSIVLKGIVETTSTFIRIELMNDIAEIGDKRAVPILEKLKEDQIHEKRDDGATFYPIREAARRALKTLSEG